MNRSLSLALGMSWALLVAPFSAIAQAAEASAIIVSIDRTNDKPVWLLNSKPMSEILLELSRLHREGVPDKPIILLVQSKATAGDVENALGIMAKAQTAKPRVFLVSSDKRSMNELAFGAAMPLAPETGQR